MFTSDIGSGFALDGQPLSVKKPALEEVLDDLGGGDEVLHLGEGLVEVLVPELLVLVAVELHPLVRDHGEGGVQLLGQDGSARLEDAHDHRLLRDGEVG